MKKVFITALLVLLLIVPSAYATTAINWHQDFDSEDSETYPGTSCVVDNFYYNPNNTTWYPNCGYSLISDIADRTSGESGAGHQSLLIYCDWVDCAGRQSSQRASCMMAQTTAWGGASGDACIEGHYNDGSEYWIGWSYFIPADYEIDQSQMILQIVTSTSHMFAIYHAGTNSDFYRVRYLYDGDLGFHSMSVKWKDLIGTWVDFVYHGVLYTTDNANAVTQLWINDINVIDKEDKDNMASGGPPLFNWPLVYTTDCYTSIDCSYCVDGGYHDPMAPWHYIYLDETRFTEQTIGTYNYCHVAPPIWAGKPSITSPTQNQDELDTTFTATYNAYSDYRSESAHNCFTAYQTDVQVDEDGGDWAALVFESANGASSSSIEVSGLAVDTTYQMRVRHSSYSSARSTEFVGSWSDTIDFTTGGDPPPVLQENRATFGGGTGAGFGQSF